MIINDRIDKNDTYDKKQDTVEHQHTPSPDYTTNLR